MEKTKRRRRSIRPLALRQPNPKRPGQVVKRSIKGEVMNTKLSAELCALSALETCIELNEKAFEQKECKLQAKFCREAGKIEACIADLKSWETEPGSRQEAFRNRCLQLKQAQGEELFRRFRADLDKLRLRRENQRDQLLGFLHQAKAETEAEQLALPLEDILQLLPEDIRPEIIPIGTDGNPVVLLRAPWQPQFAFLVFAEAKPDAPSRLKLKSRILARNFALCALDDCAESVTTLSEVCAANGIETVFVRQAGEWPKEGAICFSEAAQFHDELVRKFDFQFLLSARFWADNVIETQAVEAAA